MIASIAATGSWVRAAVTRGRRAIRAGLLPGRRAALAAAVGCAVYGALKLYWALGGGLLLHEAPLSGAAQRALLERAPHMVALNSASAALAVIGIALAVATTREGRLPRLLVVALPALIGALMLMRAIFSAAGDVAELSRGAADGSTHTAIWDLALWSPFFAAWGATWALAALAARRRSREAPKETSRPTGTPEWTFPRCRGAWPIPRQTLSADDEGTIDHHPNAHRIPDAPVTTGDRRA